jgi:hypothetical protein
MAAAGRRNQPFLAQPPVAGVDHQIAHLPGLIVDDEVIRVTDRVVAALNVISTDLNGAPQMLGGLWGFLFGAAFFWIPGIATQ